MKNIYKLTIIALLSLITINGCGGGSSTDGSDTNKKPTVEVKYTLNGTERPSCLKADDKGILNPTPNDYIICTWLCGKYQGSKTVAVSLSFEKNPKTEDGIWELDDETITEADNLICKDI